MDKKNPYYSHNESDKMMYAQMQIHMTSCNDINILILNKQPIRFCVLSFDGSEMLSARFEMARSPTTHRQTDDSCVYSMLRRCHTKHCTCTHTPHIR